MGFLHLSQVWTISPGSMVWHLLRSQARRQYLTLIPVNEMVWPLAVFWVAMSTNLTCIDLPSLFFCTVA